MDLGGWDDINMILHYTYGYDKRDSREFYHPLVQEEQLPNPKNSNDML